MRIAERLVRVFFLCLILVFSQACSRQPEAVSLPVVSAVTAPQVPLTLTTFRDSVASSRPPSSRQWRFSLLVDDGRAIEDPLLIAARESLDTAMSFSEVMLFEEEVHEVAPIPEIVLKPKTDNSVLLNHILYVPDGDGISTATQQNALLAYHAEVEQTTRRLIEVQPFEEWYNLNTDATRRFVAASVNQNVSHFFVSSPLGIPLPLREGDVIGYLDATIAPQRESNRLQYMPVVAQIAVRVVGETNLFDDVECWVARGVYSGTLTEITAYISKRTGIVVKSIIANPTEGWRVIKTIFPEPA